MKVTFTIDCTPEEAREFFGFPDVRPMQESFMRKVEERMTATVDAMSPETLMKIWMPGSVQGVEQFQKMLWGTFGAAKTRPGGDA